MQDVYSYISEENHVAGV